MTYLISTLIALAILAETLGVWGRLIGAANGEPAVGYSTHVRIATLGRFFTFLSAPMLGYYVDAGYGTREIIYIGLITFTIVFFVGILFLHSDKSYAYQLYSKLNKNKFRQPSLDKFIIHNTPLNRTFAILNVASYSMTAIGLIVVNLLATWLYEYRAMIVQMSAVITAFGTLLHVFLVDPKLANAGDVNPIKLNQLVYIFVGARTIQSLVLAFIFLVLYFTN